MGSERLAVEVGTLLRVGVATKVGKELNARVVLDNERLLSGVLNDLRDIWGSGEKGHIVKREELSVVPHDTSIDHECIWQGQGVIVDEIGSGL